MIYQTIRYLNPPIDNAEDDEAVVFHTSDMQNRFVFLKGEFDNLCQGLHSLCWKDKAIPYLQFVREWNECTGYNDITSQKSKICDVDDCIEALELLSKRLEVEKHFLEEQSDDHGLYSPSTKDLGKFRTFLQEVSSAQIYIKESWRGDDLTLKN